jgi:hypothetical protein
VLASALAASAANAALVTFTTVVTNNTTQEKSYDFSSDFELPASLGNVGGHGSFVIVVSDIRGGGAYVKTKPFTSMYTGSVGETQVAHLGLPLAENNPLIVAAGAYSQATYSASFTTESFGVNANAHDMITMRLQFVLSAGDQAMVSGTFEVLPSEPIPAPGAAALALIASGVGLRGRRRTHN